MSGNEPPIEGDLRIVPLRGGAAAAPAWEQHLSPRAKLARGSVIALALAAALILVGLNAGLGQSLLDHLTIPTAQTDLTNTNVLPTHPPARLAGGDWYALALPVSPQSLGTFVTLPNQPNSLIACSGPDLSQDIDLIPDLIELWSTADGGAHWNRLPFPQVTGLSCVVSRAPDNPGRIVVQITRSRAAGTGCGQGSFYLSGDGGVHWQPVSLGSLVATPRDDLQCVLWPSAHHLYAWLNYSAAPPHATLLRSDDDGRTWRQADAPISEFAFTPTLLGDGESLVAAVATPSRPSALWISHDAGATWQPLGATGTLGFDSVLAPTDASTGAAAATTPSATLPFYALSATQVPSLLYRLRVALLGRAGALAALPPLPVSGTNATSSGLTAALAETPSGGLFAFGANPNVGLASPGSSGTVSPQQWLWEWDHGAERWRVLASPLPVPWPTCGAQCWVAQVVLGAAPSGAGRGTYLYVEGLGATGANGIYRIYLPG